MTRIKTLAAAAALALGASGAFAQTGEFKDLPGHRITNGSQSPDARGSNRPGDVAIQPAPADVRNRYGYDPRGPVGYDRRAYDRGDYGQPSYDRGDHGRAGYDRRGDWRNNDHRGDWRNGRGDWYGHRWQRGERLPPEWRSHYYVVDDWRGHHLRRPPAGYYWVQNGSDYLLVAIATGIIASVILNQ